MQRFLEFLINHWVLSGLWLILVFGLVTYLKVKAGKTVGIHETTRMINRDNGIILDVREKKEFTRGHIVNAVNIPLGKLDERITELDKNRDKPFIVVCQMGHQSGDAVKKLKARGFEQVFRLNGGMSEWQSQGLPLVNS